MVRRGMWLSSSQLCCGLGSVKERSQGSGFSWEHHRSAAFLEQTPPLLRFVFVSVNWAGCRGWFTMTASPSFRGPCLPVLPVSDYAFNQVSLEHTQNPNNKINFCLEGHTQRYSGFSLGSVQYLGRPSGIPNWTWARHMHVKQASYILYYISPPTSSTLGFFL